MKCPYAVNRKTVTQTHIEYDDEGKQSNWTEVQNNNAFFLNCVESECGAWRDNRCCYRSD